MNEPDSQARGLELKFINLYFWVFWLQCIQGTYLNLFLKRNGLTGTEIGILGAAASVVGVLVTPFIGVRFDCSPRRPAFLSQLALLAGASFALYAFPRSLALLLPLALVLSASWGPLIPLLDSLTLSRVVTAASRRGYGGYRRWGSLGFAVGGLTVGFLAGRIGLGVIFPAYLACALVVAWLASGIPKEAAPAVRDELRLSAVGDLLRIKPFRTFLLVILFSYAGNSGCWTFRAIYLDSIGVPEAAIGALWLLPILAEVACFSFARRLIERYGTTKLMSLGILLGVMRWWLLSAQSWTPLLFVTEILHGLSFAIFYPSAVAFVSSVVPTRLRGTAQIMYFSSTAGLGGAAGAFIAGRIFDVLGVRPVLWIGGALGVVTSVLILALVKPAEGTRRAPVPPPVAE
jgi:PPP family 3-phenylpropionic acid transporter